MPSTGLNLETLNLVNVARYKDSIYTIPIYLREGNAERWKAMNFWEQEVNANCHEVSF